MCKVCEKKMTIEEVVKATINNLKGIPIPAYLSEAVGTPILQSVRNLQMCVDAIEQNIKNEDTTDSVQAENAENQ